MISRLPNWVWLGGGLLAAIGGMVNAVGFLGLTHQAITHLTGTTTLSAIALTEANGDVFLHLIALIVAYFLGSVISGVVIRESTLQLGRRYGIVLLIETGLLVLAVPLLVHGLRLGDYCAACACGLQNAMASSYSGAVIRTTHVSGMITDLGIFTGHWLRGLKPDSKKARLHSILVLGFFAGGIVGALLFPRFSYYTLLLPAFLTGSAALGYSAYRLSGLHR